MSRGGLPNSVGLIENLVGFIGAAIGLTFGVVLIAMGDWWGLLLVALGLALGAYRVYMVGFYSRPDADDEAGPPRHSTDIEDHQ